MHLRLHGLPAVSTYVCRCRCCRAISLHPCILFTSQASAIILNHVMRTLPDMPRLEIFALLMAAAVHDVGHMALNNDFLINTRHPNAITYNDVSVNENYHASQAFEMASREELDIFKGFSVQVRQRARRITLESNGYMGMTRLAITHASDDTFTGGRIQSLSSAVLSSPAAPCADTRPCDASRRVPSCLGPAARVLQLPAPCNSCIEPPWVPFR